MEPPFQDVYGQEFIERDNQYPADLRVAGDNIAETDSLKEFAGTPAGEPDMKYDVRSTFDSRPVNGYDFNITAKFEFRTGTFQAVIFEVPEGYVAVPRYWYHQFFPRPLISDLDGVLMTPQLDGADISYNIDVPVGGESDRLLETFFVCDEFQRVGFRMSTALTMPGPGSVDNLSIRVYGNLLLKDNVPAIFQVANKCGPCGEVMKLAPYTKQTPTAPAPKPAVVAPPPTPVILTVKPATRPPCPPGYAYNDKGQCIGTAKQAKPIGKSPVKKPGLGRLPPGALRRRW